MKEKMNIHCIENELLNLHPNCEKEERPAELMKGTHCRGAAWWTMAYEILSHILHWVSKQMEVKSFDTYCENNVNVLLVLNSSCISYYSFSPPL